MNKRVVASLTTIPSRINNSCRKTIDSILPQVDKIYLGVSSYYNRFGELGKIPEYLSMPGYAEKVEVVWLDDHGSVNKYLAVPESEYNSWVFICDDDQEYKIDLIKRMMISLERNNFKIGVYQNCYDWVIYGSGGVVHGFVGLILHGSTLRGLMEFPKPESSRVVDDQLMSIFFYFNNVSMFSTEINSLSDIYKVLEDGHQKIGLDSLADLGNRDQKVKEVSDYYRVEFINGGLIKRI